MAKRCRENIDTPPDLTHLLLGESGDDNYALFNTQDVTWCESVHNKHTQ